MGGRGRLFHVNRIRRGTAAASVLLALLIQFVAPFLPMPAMGGLTSVQLSVMAICRAPGPGGDRGTPDHRSHGQHCPICAVVAQASTALAPTPVDVPVRGSAAFAVHVVVPQAAPPSAWSSVFSSRAPPPYA